MIMMNVIIGYLLISSFLSYAHVYPADVASRRAGSAVGRWHGGSGGVRASELVARGFQLIALVITCIVPGEQRLK